MKKLFLLMSIMLVAFCSGYALSADEIVGKWESGTIKQEDSPAEMKMSMKLLYNFAADKSAKTNCELSMSVQIDKGMYADLFFDIAVDGNYEVAGDSIVVNYTPGTAIVTFTEDDVRIRGIEDADLVSQIKEAIFAQFSQMKEEMTAGFGTEPDVLNDVSVMGPKMIAKVDDQVVNFKRKKK